jgi:hypothetical protein
VRWAWALGLILLASSSLARAQEPQLTWQAPQACPSRDTWLSSLRARVDPAAWQQAAPKLRVTVRIELADNRYALQLDTVLDGAVGQRRLEGARCAELVEASALIVALAIDPQAAERAALSAPVVAPSGETTQPTPIEAQAAPAPVATPEPPPATPAEPKPEPAPEPDQSEPEPKRAPSSTRFFIRPLLLTDLGTLPELALGPALHAGVRFGRLSVELGASYLLGQSVTEPDTTRVIGELRWLAGHAGVCFGVLPAGRFDLAPCARFELGRIWGQGRNLEDGELSGGATWAAAVPGVRFGFEVVHGFWLDTELAAALPLLPSAFTVVGVGEVHESPAVAGRLAAGFSLHF